ncbi:hypothetical protein [Clostridium brassicae]|uniref:Uncharacterized protein n=1 Tax=Clostridium brassicae TaxID=2999072 RepID=A0ABT4D6D8_9CLOT|nr:hypothetical protein [Clostridium brassicae]MCY6957860.1 hypothetical protein [Clostridium brassicae]
MKYRKKPVVIEACKFVVGSLAPDWYAEEVKKGNIIDNKNCSGEIQIITLEGVMKAKEGDYIIKGVNGELYPCKPDIFEKTYEKI